ncbi:hypothetical protein [Hymenobacter bucti]|uniref:Uncharacterized protein n=1 Tax=Hymenobacter bucti TaxID=1844114 RepID=A0ABW4QTS1_9BACT
MNFFILYSTCFNNFVYLLPLAYYHTTNSSHSPFMPKLIDYPRTSYTGAWEVAEVVDDTGGKCALETCARKLNRKVSGSFKAIVGSGVKFGLLTSKREILTTTTLFRRIKHAYDKQEELLFHREAFLTPPLFTQLCRKFRSRELPVAMLDVLLIREFGVEEINAQSVAKAFVDGARMVGVLDENNIVADIDQLAAQQPPRRELASPPPAGNIFRQSPPTSATLTTQAATTDENEDQETETDDTPAEAEVSSAPALTQAKPSGAHRLPLPASRPAPAATTDAIAHLFGLQSTTATSEPAQTPVSTPPASSKQTPIGRENTSETTPKLLTPAALPIPGTLAAPATATEGLLFRIQLAGPGLNTQLDVVDADDLILVRALLDKIERRLKQ